MPRVWASLLCLTIGCAPEAELAIDLHTDLVPGVDFEAIRVSLGQRPEPREPDAIPDSLALAEGTRLIEYRGLAPGEETVTVELVRAEGEPLVIEVPVELDGRTAVTARYFVRPQIIAGYRVSCARLGARAWCWGAADHIFPGLPAGEIIGPTELPFPVLDLCSSFLGTCSLDTSGTLRCVERGTASEPLSTETMASHAGHRHVELDCGGLEYGIRARHRCMRDAEGRVTCNGSDSSGQLGDGAGDDESTIADDADVAGLAGAIQLTSSVAHSCALTSAGEVWCWGGNNGNLGDGTVPTRFAPVAVIGVTDAVRIDTFWGTTCALGPLGAMRCWGANDAGQVVAGEATAVLSPVAVTRVDRARDLAVGQNHICAVRAFGEVHCWGRNASGQLGDGTTEDRVEPVAGASVFGAVLAIDAGSDHTCRISNDAGELSVACWGGNAHGQLGRAPSEGLSASPLRVELPDLRYSQ